MIHFIYARFTFMLGVLLLVSACGFHLKGQQHYAFKRLYIEASAQTSQNMVAHLKKMIPMGSDTRVVSNPNEADTILILNAIRSRNSKSLSSHGATEEYTLEMAVDYQLKGANGVSLLEPDRLILHRSMTYNDQYALAKAIESEQLYQAIENDAVDQLLRRLASVQRIETD